MRGGDYINGFSIGLVLVFVVLGIPALIGLSWLIYIIWTIVYAVLSTIASM